MSRLAARPRPATPAADRGPVVSAFDLGPASADVAPAPDGPRGSWAAVAPHVALAAELPPTSGWFRLAVRVRMTDHFTVRKKGTLTAEVMTDDGPAAATLETFEWNRGLVEEFFVELPRGTERLRFDLQHADGVFVVERFDLEPVGTARALVRALRLKLQLLAAYNNFWPVVRKGGALLVSGRVGEVRRRILKGLTDARTLRLETRQASEVDAALWRRQTIGTDEIAQIRDEVAGLAGPPPVAVVIPVDRETLEQARMAVHSVLRQLYPHWQLLVAWPTDPIPDALTSAARNDSRVKFVTAGAGSDRLGDAVRRAVDAVPCEHVLVLPPDWELREHALFHLARGVMADSRAVAVTCEVPELEFIRKDEEGHEPGKPEPRRKRGLLLTRKEGHARTPRAGRAAGLDRFGLVRASSLRGAVGLGDEPTAGEVVRWATGLIPVGDDIAYVDEQLATPLDGGSLAARSGLKPRPPAGPPLFLSGDIIRISGYDHFVFCFLKGLLSLGVNVHRHPVAGLRNDLVPPAFRPPSVPRKAGVPQLIATSPFLIYKYKPDSGTAIYTMWETEKLDADWVREMNKAKVVIVPTQWGVDTFRASGVRVPIEIVPLGYDPLTFSPGPDFPDRCVFGTAGALDHGGIRKNTQRVIDLFRQAFPDEPDVRLRVKITPTSPMVNTHNDPRIDVVAALLPHGELTAWYRSITAYVNMSYAEGFGLHLLEAMACGRPLISTAYSGAADFFDDSVGYVAGHTVIDSVCEVYSGKWGDPHDADVVSHMRRVYADRAEARELGSRAAARARGYTWRDAGRQLVKVLGEYGLVERGNESV